MYPIYNNRRQRVEPPTRINGNFGPYSLQELERARMNLIAQVYRGTGEILSRVKMKCGIVPTHQGLFQGCGPHPQTNVSFESQSCELMQQKGLPWEKPVGLAAGRSLNGETTNRCLQSREHEGSHSECDSDIISEHTPTFERSFDRKDSLNTARSGPSKGADMREGCEDGRPASGSKRKREYDVATEIEASKKMKKWEDEGAEVVVSDGNESDVIVVDGEVEKSVHVACCFKCDLCDFTTLDGDDAVKHLKDSHHYAASKYAGVRKGKVIVPTFLIASMLYVNNFARYKSVIPTCPNCQKIFQDIHQCSTHNQEKHKTGTLEYGLSRVRTSTIIIVKIVPTCSVCKMHFPTITKLNHHVKKEKHSFFTAPDAEERAVLFCCCCCGEHSRSPFINFYDAQVHIMEKHAKKVSVAILITYIEKVGKVHQKLPTKPSHKKGFSANHGDRKS